MKVTVAIAFALSMLSGCAATERSGLDQVTPVRAYSVEVPTVFKAVRLFCVKEAFKVDRFEEESGSIIGHKVYGSSGYHADYTGGTAGNRTIVMNLKVKKTGAGKSELTARFTLGGGQVTATRDDEGLLADQYNLLFTYLDDSFKPE